MRLSVAILFVSLAAATAALAYHFLGENDSSLMRKKDNQVTAAASHDGKSKAKTAFHIGPLGDGRNSAVHRPTASLKPENQNNASAVSTTDHGDEDEVNELNTDIKTDTKGEDGDYRDIAGLAYKASLQLVDDERSTLTPAEYLAKIQSICSYCGSVLQHYVEMRGGGASTEAIYEFMKSDNYSIRRALSIANPFRADAMNYYESSVVGTLLSEQEFMGALREPVIDDLESYRVRIFCEKPDNRSRFACTRERF